MANKKIKKVLIFACPRSGTTIIQKIISIDLLGIPNLNEPFNNPEIVNGQPDNLYKWTHEQPSGVIKLLATNVGYVNTDRLLSVGNFNRIVIIERKNLTDCCVSLYRAEKTLRYHYYKGDLPDINPFHCDLKDVDNWIQMYKQYLTVLAQIKNNNVPYDTICYEDFMNDQIQYIADISLQKSKISTLNNSKLVASELSYQDLCTNYHEVEEKIRKELC